MPFSATRDLWLVLKARDEGSRALNSFARDIRHVGDSVRMANLMAARSQLMNQQSMNRLTGASQAMMIATQGRISQIDREIGQMKVLRAGQEEGRVSAQRLGTALNGAAASLAAMGTVSIAAAAFGAMGLKNLVDSAIEYQKQSSLTRTQVDKFATSLRDIEDIGLRVARSIGVPFEQIQPALFDIFSSMEVGAKDAEKLLVAFSKAAVAGQTDIQASARATIGILNAFQLPITDVNHLLDVQFQLVQEGIGSYEEWTARIGLVTPSAVRFGQSVELMSAALAVSTRMGLSAARSGTAVSRAMDAMSNPKAIENLAKLGISATDSAGNFRSMVDILFDFRGEIDKIPGEQKKVEKILEVFKGAGGTIEARRFLQNMLIVPGNIELFQTILKEMEGEAGSFEKAYSIMADTAAVKSELLANQWKAMKVAAGEALIPTFLKIVEALGKLFEWFNKLTPQQQSMIMKVVAIGVALLAISGIILLVVAGVAALAAAFAVAGTAILVIIGTIGLAIGLFTAFAAAVFLLWQKSEGFRNIIKGLGEQFVKFYQEEFLPMAQGIKKAWDEHMKPALDKLWQIIEEKVMPIFNKLSQFITAELLQQLGEIGRQVKDDVVKWFEVASKIIEEKVIPAIQRLTDFYHEHEETINQIIGVIIVVIGFLGKLVAFILTHVVAGIGGYLLNAIAVAIDMFTVFISRIVAVVDAFKALFNWARELGTQFGKFFNTQTLYAMGASLITGLVNGIMDKVGWLKDNILGLGGNVVGWAKKALGIASPSKEFAKLGVASIDGFVQGMKSATPMLNARVTATTGGLTSAVPMTGSNSGSMFNQNITINTQELNPRRQAAELGWLLNGSGV